MNQQLNNLKANLQNVIGDPSQYSGLVMIAGALLFIFVLFFITRLILRLEKISRITKKARQLEHFVESAAEEVKTYEDEFRKHIAHIHPSASEALTIAKRIINTLERRLSNIQSLIASGTDRDLSYAAELIRSPLDDKKDTISEVLSAAPVPHLSAKEWGPALNKLLDKMDIELERVIKIVGELDQQKRRSMSKSSNRRRFTFRSLIKHIQ